MGDRQQQSDGLREEMLSAAGSRGVGHRPEIEQPEEFVKRVREFLA